MSADRDGRNSFTALGDAAADALLANALPRIKAAVETLVARGGAARRIVGVALGGGYGRGEGGVKNGRLCNDVDFYTVVDERTTPEEMQDIADGLETLAHPFSEELGAEVEFSFPKKPSRVWHDRRRVMIQELIRNNVPIVGVDLSTLAPKLPAEELPAGEAARTLMNRGMGLLFVSAKADGDGRVKPEDAAFVLRNVNKAVLGSGDAALIARGEYAWAIRERAARLKSPAYDAAMAEKFSPSLVLPSDVRPMWRAAYGEWKAAFELLFARHGRELRRRRLWEAGRWVGRRRTFGRPGTFGMDCTVRVLLCIAEALAAERPMPSPSLVRDWEVFN